MPDTSPRDVMRIEAEALMVAAERLDEAQVALAVEMLSKSTGKVLVLGAGTSGIVARKLAATLTSTGTPALYLHPGDALHGGLGIVAPDDVVIALSNSGETDEILAALPYLRSRNVAVIAICGSTDSALAKASDVVLDAHADREACPLNLAPTCSSIIAMAVGDALAIMVMRAKKITAETFARNHPSGQLGRRLTLRVGDLMWTGKDLPLVSREVGWLEVVGEISRGGLGAVAVAEGDLLLGLITDGDLRRSLTRFTTPGGADLSAGDLMTRDPVIVGSDVMAWDALRLMEDRPSQITVLPVVDGDTLVGMIRVHDLVKAGL